MSVPTVTLNDGNQIPQVGFGVWRIPPEETAPAVSHALAAGYRSIDTAVGYDNEQAVGEAVAASGIPRDELFITTKVRNDQHGYDEAIAACRGSLDRLGMSYVDLLLIHWPIPQLDRYVQTWRGLEALRDQGLARSIGVSNFQPAHLRRLQQETSTLPAVDQIELHPWLQQAELRALCGELSVTVEAWAPLAESRFLDDPAIAAIAQRLGCTPAQVVLAWHLQLGHVVIPKSVRPERMRENLDATGIKLTDADLAAIRALDAGRRLGPDPDTFGG